MKKFARLLGLVVAISAVLMMVAVAGACDHVWTVWTTKVDPTCLKEGLQESSCDKPNCGKHAYRAVAKLDHLYVPATCTQKKHCVNGCNDERGELLPHTFAAATCVQRPKCTQCGLEEGALGRHNFVSTSCLQPKVCTECGIQSKELTSHEYTDATCQKPATCKRCGDETGGKANHSFPKVSCTMFAKCRWCEKTQRGEHQWVTEGKERICSVCQISQALKQPKPDPEYTE